MTATLTVPDPKPRDPHTEAARLDTDALARRTREELLDGAEHLAALASEALLRAWQAGHTAGHGEGYEQGYADGHARGLANGITDRHANGT